MRPRHLHPVIRCCLLALLLAGAGSAAAQTDTLSSTTSFGKWIDPDTVPPPRVVKAGNPQVVPAHPNVHPVGTTVKVPIPENLTVITPGENGVPLPDTIGYKVKTVPALHPEPVPALPALPNGNATYDIQWMGIEHGLGKNNVTQAIEDQRGHIWVGTRFEGVNRYDSRNILLYTETEGFGKGAFSIFEDSIGHIWFGTCENKIIRYDGRTFTHYILDIDKAFCISFIREDQQGGIWFGTFTEGLIRYDGICFTRYNAEHGLCSKNVQAIEVDRRGQLWVGTGKGLSRFDGKSFTQYTEKEGLIWRLILTIEEDKQGGLWVGTSRGASYYNGRSFTNYKVDEGSITPYIRRILEDSWGNIWFSILGRGLVCFDGKKFTWFTEEEGMNNNFIVYYMEDSQGNIWVIGEGIHRINPRGFMHVNGTETMRLDGVGDIHESPSGDFWLGTLGGLIRYDGASLALFPREEELWLRNVSGITEDGQGHLWMVGSRGLVRYDGEYFTHYSPAQGLSSRNARSILKACNGDIWIGTNDSGASRFDGRAFTQFTEEHGLGENNIQCLLEDERGDLLLGTSGGGLSYFDGHSIRPYLGQEGLELSNILSLFKDSHGVLWFGVEGSGLYRYEDGNLTVYSKEDGLAYSSVGTILEDKEHNIWLGTSKGISLMVPAGKGYTFGKLTRDGKYQCFNFGKEDGLNRSENGFRTALLDRHNRIWWGGSHGLTMLDLEKFELPSEPPHLMLNHIGIEQQYVDYRRLSDTAYQNTFSFGNTLSTAFDSITPFFNLPVTMALPHHLNALSFHLSGIDWAGPHKLKYSYLLEGLDKEWSAPTSENKIEYRNLPFGTFTFKARAIGAAQIWSEPFEYRFTIRPPWYHTWWAYALFFLTGASLLYGIWRYELRRRLAQAEAHRLQELDAVKTRLYTNITHEFRTPLTIINGMAGQLQSQASQSVKEGLILIKRNGQQLLQLVNQMLDLAKLESGSLPVNKVQGDVIPFLKYLLESFHSLGAAKQIALHFHSESEELIMDYDPEKLREIVGNLLSNAVKYAPEGGRVELKVGTSDGWHAGRLKASDLPPMAINENGAGKTNWLQLAVSDNGRGIPNEQLERIFARFYQVDDSATRSGEGTGIGLTLVKELVKLLGGKIEVESELGQGTTFTLWLPITKLADKQGQTPASAIEANAHENTNARIHEYTNARTHKPTNTLLIIEDNPDVTQYVSSLLNKHYTILTAPNGNASLEKQEKIPDLILCDVMMPEMDGFEVCRRLKGELNTSHIPILMLTARADIDSRIEGIERGADAYLTKPFEERELQARLRKLLENRERLRQYYTSGGFLSREAHPPARKGQPSPADQEFLERLLAAIEKNIEDPDFSADQLADLLFVSYSTCLRKVKALTGKKVNAYILHIRIHRAARLLWEEPGSKINDIATSVGFRSNTYLTRKFKEVMGCTPTEYRRSRK